MENVKEPEQVKNRIECKNPLCFSCNLAKILNIKTKWLFPSILNVTDVHSIQLNEKIIHAINLLQSDGTTHLDKKDIIFNNSGINDLLRDLTELNDYLLYVCEFGSEVELKPEITLKHCQSIRNIKDRLSELKAV